MNQEQRPFIIHSDGTIFVERRHPDIVRLCRELRMLAYQVKETEQLFMFRLNIDSARVRRATEERTAEAWIHWLRQHSKLPVPSQIAQRIKKEFASTPSPPFPEPKEFLDINLESSSRFADLRDYQRQAVEAYLGLARQEGGGIILLPCGAGKTVVGLGVMAKLQTETLILAPNATSVKQWERELLNKTTLRATEVGTYTADRKQIRPVTVTTYQMLTHRDVQEDTYPHLQALCQRNWGLVIYDEVHMLPAPVFRLTAELHAARRLGLTATLIREDGKQNEVFSLIGPLAYQCSWKDLERQGWIREAVCREMRIPMPADAERAYQMADKKQQVRIAAENPAKLEAIARLLALHEGEQMLIIGHYLRQLEEIAGRFGFPLITGRMPQALREEWYEKFRSREIPVLVVSKVANLAVDLPSASVGIQVSGTYGSRQEEAQRLGRVLRSSSSGGKAYFYQLVTENTVEEEYAWRRQCFLAEQGYRYELVELEGWMNGTGA
ncbi:superfamily II DNA or RNA helicase [Laceyella sacchari]|uniref:DEAD/DEAH box helicase n=1 Tax=Laceyella sacchari TaxID=37482 RepID=UPI00105157E9|nr:DEAD/DEAH box helicase family protein [Laceyella sacchari]TCW37860.1 superfamily II DNA or RNA helicase [Laceyella sacchari]